MKNGILKSELIQTAAAADERNLIEARDFVLEAAMKPEPVVATEEVTEQNLIETLTGLFKGHTIPMGNKISIIKLYRQLTRSGLKESKVWVEANITHDAYRF